MQTEKWVLLYYAKVLAPLVDVGIILGNTCRQRRPGKYAMKLVEILIKKKHRKYSAKQKLIYVFTS